MPSSTEPGSGAQPEPVLDDARVAGLVALSEMSGGALLQRMIDTFAARATALAAAVDAGPSAAALVEAAHELKGSSATIGARRVAVCAARLEAAGLSGRGVAAAEAAELRAELAEAITALRELSADPGRLG